MRLVKGGSGRQWSATTTRPGTSQLSPDHRDRRDRRWSARRTYTRSSPVSRDQAAPTIRTVALPDQRSAACEHAGLAASDGVSGRTLSDTWSGLVRLGYRWLGFAALAS